MSTCIKLTAIVAVALWGQTAAHAQNLSTQDQKFIEEAAKGGSMEVQMGQLGMSNGQSEEVKGLCQRLINDHTAGNRELAALAKRKGVTLPPDDAKMIAAMPLASKKGADFDREFARAAVEDHEKDIAAFEKEVNSGDDPDVRNWAKKTLPTLRAHLTEAQALSKP